MQCMQMVARIQLSAFRFQVSDRPYFVGGSVEGHPASFVPLRTRNCMEDGRTRGPAVGLCALPLIEQKALDEWGTEGFIFCGSAESVRD